MNHVGGFGASIGPTAASRVVLFAPSSTTFPVRNMASPAAVAGALVTVNVTGMSGPVSTVNDAVFDVAPEFVVSCTLYVPGGITLGDGTENVTVVSDQELAAKEVEPNITLPATAPKPWPAIVALIPDCPSNCPIEPICGTVAAGADCQTATVCGGKEKAVTGLFPLPFSTVIPKPTSKPFS